MIGLAEFCEKAGFQNALSERCHEYLVEKESVGVQVQKPMGMLLLLSANVSCKRRTIGSCLQKRG